ncbi:MAG TPA: DUF11 domain-containing protein [Candidatus Limnocylindria bacterium]|jgi:uncharacterized repeat protein (TIGR01451 family)
MRLVRVTSAALILTAALAGPALAGAPVSADLSVSKSGTPSPVAAGSNITYTITVQNLGPSTATSVNVTDTTPTNTTFVSLTAPAGWSATTPAVGGTGVVTLSNASLTVAAGAQVFTLVVNVNPGTPAATVISNTAFVVSGTPDPTPGNNNSNSTLDVAGAATPAPTPLASLADAAMPPPSSGSPLAVLGFGILLVGTLSASTVLAVRRARR